MDIKTKIKSLPLANKVKFNRHTVIGIMIAAAIVATYFVYHSFASGSDIVNVAAGQVGVHEGANNCNPYGPCEPWCADFVSWVYAHAGYDMGRIPLAANWQGALQSRGWWRGKSGAPQPGDAIIYSSNGGHIGIVDHYDNGTIYTIEGNYSDQVARVQRSISQSDIVGWGGPGVGGGGTAAASVWHPFEPLGGAVVSAVSAVSWGPGHVDAYARGTDNQIWHRWYQNGWSSWVPVPGSGGANLTGAPGVVAWASGRVDIFATDNRGHLRHTFFANNNWTGSWEDLGGTLTSGPAVTNWGSRLDVFGRGTDNALWHRWYANGGWSGWESLGGGLSEAPGAVAWGNGRIDVFVNGTDHALHHKWYAGGWSNWESLGGGVTGRPTASSRGSGRIDVFIQGTDNRLWHRWYESAGNTWNSWENLGGSLTGAPGSASWSSNRIDVFVPGNSGVMWHTWWP